jgi:hypothetical protein
MCALLTWVVVGMDRFEANDEMTAVDSRFRPDGVDGRRRFGFDNEDVEFNGSFKFI